MKWVARRVAWLLPLVLCGCTHTVNQTPMQALAPPLEDTPPPPDLAPTALPAPVPTIPKTTEPMALPAEPVKAVPKHHKSSLKAASPAQASAAPAPQPGTVAEAPPPAAPPAEESASGKFGTPEGADSQKQTESFIDDVERGLNGIGRKLSDADTKTSMQIREFLKQARTALAGGDVDGAKTLATKAKALLGELNQ